MVQPRGRKPKPTRGRAMLSAIQCGCCESPFTPRNRSRPDANACSILCQNRLQYQRRKQLPPSRVCLNCGVAFRPLLRSSLFCGRICAGQVNARNRARITTCRFCSASFMATNPAIPTCPKCSYRNRIVRTVRRNARRKAMRRGALGPTHSEAEWLQLVGFFGGRCAYCRERPVAHRDHIIPVALGGSDDISNIAPSCVSCNLRKGTKSAREFMAA